MSLEGRQRSRARIGVMVRLTETPHFLLLPLFCGPFSRLWEAPSRGIYRMIKMALGVMGFDGGVAGAHGQSLFPRNQGALTQPLCWTWPQTASLRGW
jgi:hypothetical protein